MTILIPITLGLLFISWGLYCDCGTWGAGARVYIGVVLVVVPIVGEWIARNNPSNEEDGE